MKTIHLILDDWKSIQDGIENRRSKTAIARTIGKALTTVAKEIRRYRTLIPHNRFISPQ